MADDLEEKSPESFDLQRYLGVVRRRHLPFLIALLLGWAVVWGASWILPPRYQSTTLILVEQPTMPKDYVTPNVNEDLQERMQSITQQILSWTRLIHIIEQFNLYGGDHANRSPDERVELMRKDIGIDLVRDVRNQISSFKVSYKSGDPRLAQQITGELTKLFINENLEVRRQQSEDTTRFLASQLEVARRSLSEQEDRIRQFEAQHVGEMPNQTAANLQILSGLQSQLQNEQDALNGAKQQRVYLQTLTDHYQTLQGTTIGSDGTAVGLQELDKLRAQLADLRARYTDRHPDVRRLKEQIAETERVRDQIRAAMKEKAAKGGVEATDAAPSASQLADQNQPSLLPQIQSQLRSNQVEITNREHSITELKAKVEEYQARLNQEPVREQQLADLTRGYEQSKANYDNLLKKKNESAMATSMELLQQGDRFTIVDPPSFPEKPVFPHRFNFCGIGLGVGLALGFIAAGAFEMLDRRIYDEQEIKGLLPEALLAEIPEIINPAEEKRIHKQVWLGWSTAVVVVCSILAGSVLSYLHG